MSFSAESFDERLLWLLKLTVRMTGTRDLERLGELVAESFATCTGSQRAILWMKDRETGALIQTAAMADHRATDKPAEKRVLMLANRVLKEKAPVYVTHEQQEADKSPSRVTSMLDLGPLRTAVCVPVLWESEAIGVLYADNDAPQQKPVGEPEQRIIQLFLEHAGSALENARLFARANNDPLTGLPNSSYFLLQLGKAMKEATDAMTMGIVLLDLDTFKRINIVAGAEMGDRALMDIANTLQDVWRTDGLVARYGSDKFALLLPPEEGTPIGLRLRDVAERARAAISTKAFHGVTMSACIGGVAYPRSEAKSPSDLVALADDVLSTARARGPGNVDVVG